MMKWWKRFSKNHKGFSLVEVICTVAILSIVVTSAGSAMVISAKSYQRGNTELDLQQQAQITANLLTNLIIDANKIEISDGGKTFTVDKADPEVYYKIALVEDEHEEWKNELKYQEKYQETDDFGPIDDMKTLAEHIGDFSIKRVSENNYDFNLKVVSADGRTFSSDYHVTPRNSSSVRSLTEMTNGNSAAIYAENKIVLEPNETYLLNVNVANAVAGDDGWPFQIAGITGATDGGTSVVPYTNPDEPEYAGKNTIKIVVGGNERGSLPNNSFYITLAAKNSEGTEVTLTVEVLVRRVTAISVQGQKLNGNRAKAGAVYNVTAQTTGSNLPRVPGAWYDINYMPTYPVTWEVQGEGLSGSWSDYVDVLASYGDISDPFCQVKLKQDIPLGGAIKIIATAKHPAGTDSAGNKTNKTGLLYDVIRGEYVIRNASSINRGASGDADIPPFTFNVGDLGQLRKVVEAVYQAKIQANWSGTTNASYNEVKAIWDNESVYERNGNEALNYFNGRQPISYAEFRYVMDEEKSDESKWSPWIPMTEYKDGTPIFRPKEADYFRPDKDYTLQVKVSLVESGNPSIVYWPLEDTEQDQYMTEYFVSKVTISDMYFEWSTWPEGWHTTKGIDTVANIPKDQTFFFKIAEIIGYSQNGAHDHVYLRLEKEVSEGVWEDVTDSVDAKWRSAAGKSDVVIEYNNLKVSEPGKYRILPYMQDISYKANVNAEEEKLSLDLYDLSTGNGIVYFNIVN